MKEEDTKREEKIIKSFSFDIPVELVKSKVTEGEEEAEDSWRIRGIASTEDHDLQGEQLLQDGIDLSVIKSGKGLFNNNHSNQPEDILGEIDDAKVIEIDNKKCLEVDGYLFKHQLRAQAYYNIMRSVRKGGASRVHYSVEGKVIERDARDSTKIRKALITKVALTLDPVNPYTFAELAKSLHADMTNPTVTPPVPSQEEIFQAVIEFTKSEVTKAMSAGYGGEKAPEARSGGEVSQKESLDKKKKDLRKKVKKGDKDKIIKSINEIIEQFFENYSKETK